MFEAVWRKYTLVFEGEQRSRLLLVLVQSGVAWTIGPMTCERASLATAQEMKVAPAQQRLPALFQRVSGNCSHGLNESSDSELDPEQAASAAPKTEEKPPKA